MHQKSSTQHKHSYMQTVTSNEEEGILSLVQTHGMQTNSRPIQTFCTPEVRTHTDISAIKKILVDSCLGRSLQMIMPIEFPE